MMPDHLHQMIQRYPALRGQFLLVLTLAVLKERTAIDAWLATDFPATFQAAPLGDSAGERFGRSILDALRNLGDGEKETESRELYRGGAARGLLTKPGRRGACGRGRGGCAIRVAGGGGRGGAFLKFGHLPYRNVLRFAYPHQPIAG